jgi:ATP:ADP antiporter, AAA family
LEAYALDRTTATVVRPDRTRMKFLSREAKQRGTLAAMLASGTVIAHLVAAKAARDALFLAGFDVALLPRMMMLGALVSLGTALVTARVMERMAPAKLLLGTLAVNAVLYVVELTLMDALPRPVAIGLYIHVSAFGSTLIAALWSLVNERFDPHAAKLEVSRIALGGSVGGVLGGVASWLVSGSSGLPFLFVMLAALNLATIGIVLWASRAGGWGRSRARPEPTRRVSALTTLRTNPYLSTLALLVALSSLTSALLDYSLSARVVAHNLDSGQLASFFALFHASVGLLAMLVQLTLTRTSLERLGLGGTVALVPGTVVAMGLVALGFPQLWSAVLLRGSEALVQGSLSRSAYELFYTPLPREQKRPTKMLIDVGIDRLGTVAGGALTTLVVSVLAIRGVRVLVVLAMCVSIGALFCAVRLNRGYVEALAGRLRRGTIKLDPKRVLDATTRQTLAESTGIDRNELLLAIQRHETDRPPPYTGGSEPSEDLEPEDTVLVGPGGAGFEVAPGYVGLQLGSVTAFEESDAWQDDAVLRSVAALRSADPERIRSVLDAQLAPELAAHVIPLLGSNEVAREALRALRGMAPRIAGTLADALLDPASSVVVRRRIPRVLEQAPTARAVPALVDGLFDAKLEVRSQCALALLRVLDFNQGTQLPRERIFDAIEREMKHEGPLLAAAGEADAFDDEPGFGAKELRARVHQGVEHVMTLLALVLEREPVRLAYHALYSDDGAIRGTALEYLDNVLPERIRRGVLLLVEGSVEPAAPGPRRDRATLVDELLRSRELLVPAALRNPQRDAPPE